ncbi:wall-associated receptor kinase 3-like isoform X1 [Hordeum vulgare subsp. vulgare]|uniref:Protein kinase domain-containing protein n=1 Tax=Hordeum vulgare subsp. vulgare TaxID=112509 RepID=A0A8I6YAK3_HORVV|nr:wall-associated receptor kinase 3-like isoform X1 [Hordeum vulgare subsp. vulgare]
MKILGEQGNPCATALYIFLGQLLLLCLCTLFCTGFSQPNPTKCPGSSVDISSPFNILVNSSISRNPGFDISCESTGPMLSLGGKQYRVLGISVPQGYVRVTGDTVYNQCQQNAGPVTRKFIDLQGTPFTFSHTLNKFTVVGCDSMAMIRSPDVTSRPSYRGGCVSFCASEGSITSGTCSGVGCCQASVPEELKVLNLEFTSIRSQLLQSSGSLENISKSNSTWCGKAFIVDQGSYVFSKDHLHRNLTNLPMVLDWSISRGNCLEARHAPQTYMCKENTECYTMASNTAYRCNCSEGFTGNPYLGCQDIDECKDKNKYPCIHKCINRIGGFNCTCPMGMTGDGKKHGTGCNRDTTLVIAAGGGLPLLLVLLMLGFWTHWLVTKRKLAKIRQKYFLQNGGMLLKQQMFSRRAPLRIFTSSELEKATNRFSDDNIAGRGGFGTVYKGILSDQMVVAIKKAQRVDQSQVEQFVNEMVILSQVNHKNVVQLVGCCLESEVPLLVYEFITNGALFHHLHNTSALMPWKERLRIAMETATALAYLHMASEMPIIHRDVKSSNILLDESFTAKVSDFGASRPMAHNQTHVTTLVQGTLGYMDPEYFQTSQLTERSDVYSFGVVLIELLTRQKPIFGGKMDEVRSLALHFSILFHENRLSEIVDRLVYEEAGARHVKTVAQLALRCLRVKGEERPRMVEVAVEVEALRRLMKQHCIVNSEE